MLAAAIAAASILATAPIASAAAPSDGFSVRPVEINPNNPLTRAYFILRVKAGATLTRHVVIVNSGSQPTELLIYPVDGLTGVTSGDVYANRSVPKRGAGRWVLHATESIRIPGYGHFVAPFQLKVPGNATPGDHLAGIAVEAAAPSTATSGRFSVTEILREVVGVEIIVAGPAKPRIALRGASLAALPGTDYPGVTVKLANTGRALCKPLLRVTLRAPGRAAVTATEQLDTVLPGAAIPYPFEWPHPLAAGTYGASVVASHCGPTAVLRTSVRLGTTLARTPAASTSDARVIVRSGGGGGGGVGVWMFAAIALGGLGLGVAVTRGLHRRAPRP